MCCSYRLAAVVGNASPLGPEVATDLFASSKDITGEDAPSSGTAVLGYYRIVVATLSPVAPAVVRLEGQSLFKTYLASVQLSLASDFVLNGTTRLPSVVCYNYRHAVVILSDL